MQFGASCYGFGAIQIATLADKKEAGSVSLIWYASAFLMLSVTIVCELRGATSQRLTLIDQGNF